VSWDGPRMTRDCAMWLAILTLSVVLTGCDAQARANSVPTFIPQPTPNRTMDAVVRGLVTVVVPTLSTTPLSGARLASESPISRPATTSIPGGALMTAPPRTATLPSTPHSLTAAAVPTRASTATSTSPPVPTATRAIPTVTPENTPTTAAVRTPTATRAT
jgi:hypothetical protein